MFYEDTSFDSVLNHEKKRGFDVVNRVIKDDHQTKNDHQKQQQPRNQLNYFDQQYKELNNQQQQSSKFNYLDNLNQTMNNSTLFQANNAYFNDNNNNLIDNQIDQKSFMDFQMDKSDQFLQNNLINTPSNISSPNSNYTNYFTFHHSNQFQNQLTNHLTNHKHANSLENGKQTNLSSKLTGCIWHERPTPSIHTLHPELWAIIFKNLNIRDKGGIARTCTFFRDVVYGKSVWKGEIARLHLKKRHAIVLESLTRRGIKSIQVRI